jgi:phosphohistidine phosphatase
MGRWLREEGLIPDRVVASPALRARETAMLVARELRIDPDRIRWAEDIYEAGLEGLLGVYRDHAPGADLLLMIGHNPGFDELLTYLCSEPPPADAEGKLLTTAAVAVLDFADAPVSEGAGQARLQVLMRPRELQSAD